MVLILNLFLPAEFSLNLFYNFDSPVRIKTVEKHSKGEYDVFEMPRETGLTDGVMAVFPANG
jgi:hypothetical protein